MVATEHAPGLVPPAFTDAPRLLIVAAPYYRDIADMLLAGARAALEAAGARHDLVEVPGALEVPTAIRLAERRFAGFVALGCVIRGETTHYETVCNDSSRMLALLGAERGLCVGNGILTVENREQAVARANPLGQNKGGGAAEAALHLLALKRRFAGPATGEGDIRLAGDPVIGGV